MKQLYAIPTWNCNLNCPHCAIKNRKDNFNEIKFISELNSFDGRIVLFGGECTSNLKRMISIFNNNHEYGRSKISSVSTNLINLSDEILNIYKQLDSIATSWNPNRFNQKEYDIWMKHCKVISENNINYIIMITLTDDLFSMNINDFISMMKTWDLPNLKQIKFEHYVGPEATPDYFERADEWLCKIYKLWNLNAKFGMVERVCNWKFNCSNIYSLLPDGTLINQCPHMLEYHIPEECFTCERANKCRPCRLQKYCSYPKKLANLIGETAND